MKTTWEQDQDRYRSYIVEVKMPSGLRRKTVGRHLRFLNYEPGCCLNRTRGGALRTEADDTAEELRLEPPASSLLISMTQGECKSKHR